MSDEAALVRAQLRVDEVRHLRLDERCYGCGHLTMLHIDNDSGDWWCSLYDCDCTRTGEPAAAAPAGDVHHVEPKEANPLTVREMHESGQIGDEEVSLILEGRMEPDDLIGGEA